MKGEIWFPIKCNNVPKSQVMKEGSNGTTLGEKLLDVFKKENEKKTGARYDSKKMVWLSKVLGRPMRSLVICLKKKAAQNFLL